METLRRKEQNKAAALVAYSIALICLILGLFLPLTSGDHILALQLPEVFDAVSGKQNHFILTYPVRLFDTGPTVDIMAWIVLVYTVVTVLGLAGLIIAIASKKYSKTARVIAYIIEVTAAIVLSLYAILLAQAVVLGTTELLSYALLIALGGTLLALILQSLIYKKASGVAKFFLFALSLGSVFFLYNLPVLIPQMARTWANIADALKSSVVLYGDIDGMQVLFYAFTGQLPSVLGAAGFAERAALVLALATGILALFNCLVDLIGLSVRTKRAGLIFNNVRFLLELVVLIGLYVAVAVAKVQFGMLLHLLTLIALVQFVFSIVRFVCYKKRAKQEKLFTRESRESLYTEENTEEHPEETPNVPEQQNPDLPVRRETGENSDPAPVETRIYKVNNVYQGPTDTFLRKLSNDEKVEFAMTFIEKTKGSLGNIPDYVIGGDNRNFFSSIFIYLGKVRSLVSDGLLNKMYQELNMI